MSWGYGHRAAVNSLSPMKRVLLILQVSQIQHHIRIAVL